MHPVLHIAHTREASAVRGPVRSAQAAWLSMLHHHHTRRADVGVSGYAVGYSAG